MPFPTGIMKPSLREGVGNPHYLSIPDGSRMDVVQKIVFDPDFQMLAIEALGLAEKVATAEKHGQQDLETAAQLEEIKKRQRELPIIQKTRATTSEILGAEVLYHSFTQHTMDGWLKAEQARSPRK